MSRFPVMSTLVATVLTGFFLVAAVLLGAGEVLADKQVSPAAAEPPAKDLKSSLDASDEIAALAAVQFTLTEVADGSTFQWHRAHGRLSGLFEPTSSFRDGAGQVCRHLRITLISGLVTRKVEGVACRDGKGLWMLDG